MRALVATLTVLLALPLGGCLEVTERLTLEREGNGTYHLTLRWDADLLARVRDHVGERALQAFEGRAFPLSSTALRDGLAPLSGVRIERLDEAAGEAGWRAIDLQVRFDSLEALLRWEVLASRPFTLGPAGEGRMARLRMRPIERLPVLDPVREAFEARAGPPVRTVPAEAQKDPAPWARLGWDEARLLQLERWLVPALERVRLSFEVAPAGRVLQAGASAESQEERSARFTWRWADLLARVPREVDLRFQAGEFDTIPEVRQPPEQAPADAAPPK
jgi:hypothetical protein